MKQKQTSTFTPAIHVVHRSQDGGGNTTGGPSAWSTRSTSEAEEAGRQRVVSGCFGEEGEWWGDTYLKERWQELKWFDNGDI